MEERIAEILARWMAGAFSIRGVGYNAAENKTLRWPEDFGESEQAGFRAVAKAVAAECAAEPTR